MGLKVVLLWERRGALILWGGQRRWTQIRSNNRKTNRFFYLQRKLVVFLTVLLLDGGKSSQEEKNPERIPVCNLCTFLILQGFFLICLYF